MAQELDCPAHSSAVRGFFGQPISSGFHHDAKQTYATQADLFAAMLQNSAQEARRVLMRAGGGLQVRSTALLSLPSDMTARLTALRDAGLGGLKVHGMTFSVDEKALTDQCDPPCAPDQEGKLSSNGEWVCIPGS